MKKRLLLLSWLFFAGLASVAAGAADDSGAWMRLRSAPSSGVNDEDAAAMYLLGNMFARGAGVPQDDAAAFRWYVRAARLGNADAINNVGTAYATGRGVAAPNPPEALRWYRRAAEKGSLEGMSNLARAYYLGEGAPVNYAKATVWFERAAKEGHPSAMNTLGTMYAQGRGVRQDPSKAFALYQQSATLGNAAAMLNLGAVYARGEIAQQDDLAAFVWFGRALKAGVPEAERAVAMRDMEILASRLSPDQLGQARRLIDNASSGTNRERSGAEPYRPAPTIQLLSG